MIGCVNIKSHLISLLKAINRTIYLIQQYCILQLNDKNYQQFSIGEPLSTRKYPKHQSTNETAKYLQHPNRIAPQNMETNARNNSTKKQKTNLQKCKTHLISNMVRNGKNRKEKKNFRVNAKKQHFVELPSQHHHTSAVVHRSQAED